MQTLCLLLSGFEAHLVGVEAGEMGSFLVTGAHPVEVGAGEMGSLPGIEPHPVDAEQGEMGSFPGIEAHPVEVGPGEIGSFPRILCCLYDFLFPQKAVRENQIVSKISFC